MVAWAGKVAVRMEISRWSGRIISWHGGWWGREVKDGIWVSASAIPQDEILRFPKDLSTGFILHLSVEFCYVMPFHLFTTSICTSLWAIFISFINSTLPGLKVLVTQLCPTLCNPIDCNPAGSSVHGDSLGRNTGVGCHVLFQEIFPTQGLNLGLLHCRQTLYHLSHQGSPLPGLSSAN